MKSDLDAFRRAIGLSVGALRAAVMFYSVEGSGTIVSLSVEFEDGPHFAFGCSGDGSVFVKRLRDRAEAVPPGDPPGFVTLLRDISNVAGRLESVEVADVSLALNIAGKQILIVNDCDELCLRIDDQPVPEELVLRDTSLLADRRRQSP